jgi:MFS family permease
MVLGSICAILGGWALDRYGPRIILLIMGICTGLSLLLTSQTNSFWQLFITYSLLLSIGTGALHTVAMSTVSRWFDKKRGLAIGMIISGSGIGQVIMAPFATFLISNFNWRIAYTLIGLISWVIVIPLSRLLKKDPHEIRALPDGVNSYSNSKDIENKKEGIQQVNYSLLQVLKTKDFWFLLSLWLFWSSSALLVLTHIVPYAIDIGHSSGEAAMVLSLLGGTSIAGGVLMGKISDSIGRKKVAIICSLVMAGAIIWLIWAQNLWMLYIFAVVFGFAQGGLGPPINVLVGNTFGLRNLGVIMGFLNIGWGLGSAIGPAIGGLIFDIRGSYSLAFLIGTVAMLLGTVSIALIKKS